MKNLIKLKDNEGKALIVDRDKISYAYVEDTFLCIGVEGCSGELYVSNTHENIDIIMNSQYPSSLDKVSMVSLGNTTGINQCDSPTSRAAVDEQDKGYLKCYFSPVWR